MSTILLVASSFEGNSMIGAFNKNDKGVQLPEDSHYPLGLAYLHSYLELEGNQVYTLALNHVNYETCFNMVISKIIETSPTIIGLQILTQNRVSTYQLIEYIHEYYPDIKIILGGIHATVMYEQLLKKHPYVIIIRGEGEITFVELVNELKKDHPVLNNVNGIAFDDCDKLILTSPRDLISNLDDLPFPKHELFFNTTRTTGCIMTSRGCPFNCSFCVLNPTAKRTVRFRSIENVVEEIEYLIKKFPDMSDIWIHDDSFFINNDRVISFCDEIVKRNIKINFICSGRIKPLKPEIVPKLEQAGFKKVLFGLESGDNTILKKCHKNITQEDAIRAFKMFSKSSIELSAFLIVGLPGETIETVMNTAKFVQKLQRIKYVYYYDIAILFIYPGTEVYEIAKSAGLLTDDYWLTDETTPTFTAENNIDQLFEFKNIILDHISYNRIVSRAGFKAQFKMVPYIIGYLLKYHRKEIIKKIFKYTIPKTSAKKKCKIVPQNL